MGTRRPIETPLAPNQRWSLDFVSDQLTDARRFRILAVVDDCTRERLALVADTSISSPPRPSRYHTRQPLHVWKQICPLVTFRSS
jgi:transposase InsO family protein